MSLHLYTTKVIKNHEISCRATFFINNMKVRKDQQEAKLKISCGSPLLFSIKAEEIPATLPQIDRTVADFF